MSANTRHARQILAILTLAAVAPAALAHPGHDAGAGFMSGVIHPLTGLDHVLMIVAVSAWAAAMKPASRAVVAACLGLFVALGAALPVAPLAGPALEVAIALTVIGAGLLLALGRRWSLPAVAAVAALFALVHGFAHGAEGPANTPMYVPGLVAATAGLAMAVSFLAARMQRRSLWLRGAGAVGALAGLTVLLNT